MIRLGFFLSFFILAVYSLNAMEEDIEEVKKRLSTIKFIEQKLLGTKEERIAKFVHTFNALSLPERQAIIKNHFWMDSNTGRMKEEFYDCNDEDRQQLWYRLNLQGIPDVDET